jgi:hypothetical protein
VKQSKAFLSKTCYHRANTFSGIVHALSKKRSLNLEETFAVSKFKKSLKNTIVFIVFLEITEKLGLERFVTRFCNKMMGKTVFSHLARYPRFGGSLKIHLFDGPKSVEVSRDGAWKPLNRVWKPLNRVWKRLDAFFWA